MVKERRYIKHEINLITMLKKYSRMLVTWQMREKSYPEHRFISIRQTYRLEIQGKEIINDKSE